MGLSGLQRRATAAGCRFLGSIVRVFMRIKEGELFLDTFNNPHLELPGTGQPLSVWFPKEVCLVDSGGENG